MSAQERSNVITRVEQTQWGKRIKVTYSSSVTGLDRFVATCPTNTSCLSLLYSPSSKELNGSLFLPPSV